MSMRVKELLAIGQKQLEECKIQDAAIDSKLLYSYMMHVPKGRLIMEYQNILPDMQCDDYFALLDRRSAGEPLQYIVGETDFMGHTFKVNPDVLIPRQDTETMVETAINMINEKGAQLDVLDLCTGSGAIGISVAKACSNAKVSCSDISEKALAVARSNADKLKANVTFSLGNLFEPFNKRFKKKLKFDMILTNPPYIKSGDIPGLQVEIKDHEPMLALDGGEDGLDLVREIIKMAPDYMKPSAVIMIEIADDEMPEVLELLKADGRYTEVKGLKDLAEKDRFAYAVLA